MKSKPGLIAIVARGPWPGPVSTPSVFLSIFSLFRPDRQSVQCSRTASGQRLAALFGRGQRPRRSCHLKATGVSYRQQPRLACCRAAGSGQHAVGRSNGQEPRRQARTGEHLSIIVEIRPHTCSACSLALPGARRLPRSRSAVQCSAAAAILASDRLFCSFLGLV